MYNSGWMHSGRTVASQKSPNAATGLCARDLHRNATQHSFFPLSDTYMLCQFAQHLTTTELRCGSTLSHPASRTGHKRRVATIPPPMQASLHRATRPQVADHYEQLASPTLSFFTAGTRAYARIQTYYRAHFGQFATGARVHPQDLSRSSRAAALRR